MEEFPNNSQRAQQGIPPEVDKQIEKIIEGSATVRKPSGWKRFRQSFIAGDATSVGEHVLWNLLIPAAQDAIADMGRTFIDMMIFGTKRNHFGSGPAGGFGSTSKINYGSISSGSRLVVPQNNPILEPPRHRFSPNDIVVRSRTEAEDIINKMFEVLERYQAVSVADLYRMVGVSSDYTDSKWGWTNLDNAGTKRTGGGVLLLLPPPTDIS